LEWLLNTRRIFQEPSPELKEVNRSVYMFGLPDLSTFSMGSSTDQAKLVRQLLSTIKLFEPRLTDVRIVPVENSATGIQEFRFRIEAMLRMDPSPEPISFDSVIELKSGNCRLSGTAYA
jgi:type VI secretion system protein ImpF